MTAADTAAIDRETESRIERKRNQRIHQILKTAAEVIAERGYHATSLDEVAERLDLTKASLYHYFPSKQALVTACIELLGTEATTRLETLSASLEGPPHKRLRALIQDQIAILTLDYPETARLFLQPQDWPQPHRTRVKELRQRHDRVFRNIVEEGVRSGVFDVVSIDMALHCLHGSLNHAPQWNPATSRRHLDKLREELTDTVMKIVAPNPDWELP